MTDRRLVRAPSPFCASSASTSVRSSVGGMLGVALGMFFPFQWIVRAGHGSKISVIEGITAAALTIGFAAKRAARLTLRLESKP